MFLENVSKYDFNVTIEKVKKEIENYSWKISAIHNLQQTLKNHDKNILPVLVFAICNPKYSAEILENDDHRIISPMMPCRISIYEKSNGKTYISRMNSIPMAKEFGGKIEQVIINSSREVEEMLSELFIHE